MRSPKPWRGDSRVDADSGVAVLARAVSTSVATLWVASAPAVCARTVSETSATASNPTATPIAIPTRDRVQASTRIRGLLWLNGPGREYDGEGYLFEMEELFSSLYAPWPSRSTKRKRVVGSTSVSRSRSRIGLPPPL